MEDERLLYGVVIGHFRIKNFLKNLCLGLDIWVTKIVKSDTPQSVLFKQLGKGGCQVVGRDQVAHFIYADVLQILLVVALSA